MWLQRQWWWLQGWCLQRQGVACTAAEGTSKHSSGGFRATVPSVEAAGPGTQRQGQQRWPWTLGPGREREPGRGGSLEGQGLNAWLQALTLHGMDFGSSPGGQRSGTGTQPRLAGGSGCDPEVSRRSSEGCPLHGAGRVGSSVQGNTRKRALPMVGSLGLSRVGRDESCSTQAQDTNPGMLGWSMPNTRA